MQSGVTWSIQPGGETAIKLRGFLTDEANLAGLLEHISGRVVIDLEGVLRVNSAGVVEWIKFMRKVSSKAEVILDRCPPAMVRQFALVRSMRGDAEIRSVLLPFHCPQCDLAATRSLAYEDLQTIGPTMETNCSVCGAPMALDEDPAMYSGLAGTAPQDELLGAVLDRKYELTACIGAGSMGRVYRALQLRCLRRNVAVKVLNKFLSADGNIARRFENEAKVAGELRHPNTVKLIDFGTIAEGRGYIVTELLSGETLERRLRRGPLSWLETLQILYQAASALEEAHAAGVVHRDLKPANIFIERIGNQEIVKVLDFGLARISGGETLTSPNALIGTPAYMAPEQTTGDPIDGRTDLYSLGAIAYECLSGQPVFTGATPMSIVLKLANDVPMPLEFTAGLEQPQSAFIMQLLAKRPEDRPRSASALREAIDSWLERAVAAPDAVSGIFHEVTPDTRPSSAKGPAIGTGSNEFAENSSSAPSFRETTAPTDMGVPSDLPPLVPPKITSIPAAPPLVSPLAPPVLPPPVEVMSAPAPTSGSGPSMQSEPIRPPSSRPRAPIPRVSTSTRLRLRSRRLEAMILAAIIALAAGVAWSLLGSDRASAPATALVEVRSVPNGAAIFVGQQPTAYQTPAAIRLKVGERVLIELDKSGYRRSRVQIDVHDDNDPVQLKLDPLH